METFEHSLDVSVAYFTERETGVCSGKVTNLDRGAPGGYGQLSNRTARGGSGCPGCVSLQRAPGQGLPAARSNSSSAPSLGPLLDTIQEANQEDVSRQVVHPAVHQDAALRAAELVPGADNVLQAAAAEGVLARQHLGRGVQALQAHRALQEIQKRRRLVHVGGEGEHLGFSVRGDAAATGSCTVEVNREHRTFWGADRREAARGRPTTESPCTELLPLCCECSPLFCTSLCVSLPHNVFLCLARSLCLPLLSPAAVQKAVRSRSHHHHPRADHSCGARSRTRDRLIPTGREREGESERERPYNPRGRQLRSLITTS